MPTFQVLTHKNARVQSKCKKNDSVELLDQEKKNRPQLQDLTTGLLMALELGLLDATIRAGSSWLLCQAPPVTS
jgi:hypothetical protein